MGARSEARPRTTFAATVGDGAASSIDVAHGLGSADVLVQVRTLATGIVDTQVQVTITDENNVQLDFIAPPDLDSLRVVIVA